MRIIRINNQFLKWFFSTCKYRERGFFFAIWFVGPAFYFNYNKTIEKMRHCWNDRMPRHSSCIQKPRFGFCTRGIYLSFKISLKILIFNNYEISWTCILFIIKPNYFSKLVLNDIQHFYHLKPQIVRIKYKSHF